MNTVCEMYIVSLTLYFIQMNGTHFESFALIYFANKVGASLEDPQSSGCVPCIPRSEKRLDVRIFSVVR